MKKAALITGATGGIGVEFAKIFAKNGNDLVLIARSEDKLNALKNELENEFGINVLVIANDLSKPNTVAEIFKITQENGIFIDNLVNNAGFGWHGEFCAQNLAKFNEMINLNITALTEFCHIFGNEMIKNGGGKILNVSSMASFMPGPFLAVYYATKAYVTSFSQALFEELKDKNVSVSVLCPGAVKTGFVKNGNLKGVKAWAFAKDAYSVALCGYNAMQKGDLIAFNQGELKFASDFILPFLPRKTILKISRKVMEKKSEF
ncbi:SDR family NAD(P)-dependent oxidoreductase [Campylobacter mucosalis]|uniref:SDR family NAD(P)-dependent oxidoreductase n=1 Tax=Campylobacter mucosalis TaxID=202 RepID=UPI0014705494|nr:SDR family oxidoreductase [Campylobacter mucosalis]